MTKVELALLIGGLTSVGISLAMLYYGAQEALELQSLKVSPIKDGFNSTNYIVSNADTLATPPGIVKNAGDVINMLDPVADPYACAIKLAGTNPENFGIPKIITGSDPAKIPLKNPDKTQVLVRSPFEKDQKIDPCFPVESKKPKFVRMTPDMLGEITANRRFELAFAGDDQRKKLEIVSGYLNKDYVAGVESFASLLPIYILLVGPIVATGGFLVYKLVEDTHRSVKLDEANAAYRAGLSAKDRQPAIPDYMVQGDDYSRSDAELIRQIKQAHQQKGLPPLEEAQRESMLDYYPESKPPSPSGLTGEIVQNEAPPRNDYFIPLTSIIENSPEGQKKAIHELHESTRRHGPYGAYVRKHEGDHLGAIFQGGALKGSWCPQVIGKVDKNGELCDASIEGVLRSDMDRIGAARILMAPDVLSPGDAGLAAAAIKEVEEPIAKEMLEGELHTRVQALVGRYNKLDIDPPKIFLKILAKE